MRKRLGKVWVVGVFCLSTATGALGVYPNYYSVDFESDTLGFLPTTNTFLPMGTNLALHFSDLTVNSPGYLVVTNNMFGNTSQFALLTNGDGGGSVLTAMIAPGFEPTNGLLRVSMQLASKTLTNTINWLPLTFTNVVDDIVNNIDLTLDFTTAGNFRVFSQSGHFTNYAGQYATNQFTNISFLIDLATRDFQFVTGTNVQFSANLGGPQSWIAFQKIEPGPSGGVDVGVGTFGIDNFSMQMVPEPSTNALLIVGAIGMAAMLRRRGRR